MRTLLLRAEPPLRAVCAGAVVLFLAAWPWEIFQRLPFGGTVASAAGLVLIAASAPLALLHGDDTLSLLGAAARRFAGPVLLIALACGQSYFHSADPAASRALLVQYALYLALFLTALPCLRAPDDAAFGWRVLAVSAALVGAAGVACAAGLLAPALAGTQTYFGQRIAGDLRGGAFVRMAVTTPDFNQGILPLLAALPAAALLFCGRRGGLAAALLVLVSLAGVLISFSRSGLVAVAALAGAALLAAIRGRSGPAARRTLLAAAAAALVGLGLLFLTDYPQTLAARAMRMFSPDDPSFSSRMYVFRLAFGLLPEYWLTGCGLGAAPAVIGAAADRHVWMGTAIHSMPLLLLFETGVLGLAGYLWFWGALVSGIRGGLLRSGDRARVRLGGVALASSGVLFWMLAIQPFQALSLFPLLAALLAAPALKVGPERLAALGPPFRGGIRGSEPGDVPDSGALADTKNIPRPRRRGHPPRGGTKRARALRFTPVVAVLLLALGGLVCVNQLTFQRLTRTTETFAERMEAGLAAEARGDWTGAHDAYAAAQQVAEAGDGLSRSSYYAEAALAADLDFLLERMVGGGGMAVTPEAAARFGVARMFLAEGKTAEAASRLRALAEGAAAPWPEIWFALGEAEWADGRQAAAVAAWARAVQCAPGAPPRHVLSPNPPFTKRLEDLTREYDQLAAANAPEIRAMRVQLLLRLGRAEEARELLNEEGPGASAEMQAWRERMVSVLR
ncbi:MAG: O-antigen ligase family protein [Candidatus Hydrogenedentes bacterium]|nr:O-antigen ligase family protein [Candidatus Hydrogenedentota bacterium]